MWPVGVGGVTLHFCFIVIIIITITKLSGPQVPWCPRCFSRIVHAQQAFVAPEYSQLSIISGGKTIKIQLVPPTGDVTALHTEYGLAKKEKRRRRRKKKTALFDFPVMLVWIWTSIVKLKTACLYLGFLEEATAQLTALSSRDWRTVQTFQIEWHCNYIL